MRLDVLRLPRHWANLTTQANARGYYSLLEQACITHFRSFPGMRFFVEAAREADGDRCTGEALCARIDCCEDETLAQIAAGFIEYSFF
ncbi:hypothetical protein D3C75_1132310 [compost metagenome]